MDFPWTPGVLVRPLHPVHFGCSIFQSCCIFPESVTLSTTPLQPHTPPPTSHHDAAEVDRGAAATAPAAAAECGVDAAAQLHRRARLLPRRRGSRCGPVRRRSSTASERTKAFGMGHFRCGSNSNKAQAWPCGDVANSSSSQGTDVAFRRNSDSSSSSKANQGHVSLLPVAA